MKRTGRFALATEFLLATAILGIAILVSSAVVFRYVFNSPISFSFEASTLIFAWIIFGGAAIATARDEHIGVTLIDRFLQARASRNVRIARLLVVLGCSMYLVYAGSTLALRAGGKIPSLNIANTWLYASLPIGFAFVAAVAVHKLVKELGARASNPVPPEGN